MNKFSISVIGLAGMFAALPALANASAQRCPPKRPSVLLDHGPRADTTPYLNRLRQQRYEEAVKACQAGRR